ncbi:MAG: response regulator [Myxococcota bacterium]
MHILICEDEHFIRRALAEHLAALQYEVSEVENGVECVEFLSQTLPDLILMDLKMPKLGGYDTIAVIKEKKIEIPIILTSGFGDNEAVDASYHHVRKPYRLNEVSDLIKTHFGEPRQK